jgi:parallel beta-helix repeat protein
MRRACFFALAMLIAAAGSAPCRTWFVNPDGTGDQPSIMAAIYYGADGDTVLLADGIYTGQDNTEVTYRGKAVVVASQSRDPHLCIIDCRGSESNWSRGFLFYYGEGPGSVLEGVTIRNGYGYEGGGIWCWASSPRLSNIILSGNTAVFSGGGIYCGGGSSPEIRNLTIFGNRAADGGGLYCISGSSPTIGNTIVAYNLEGCGIAVADSECLPGLTCCDVYGNAGGDWIPQISDQYGSNGNISLAPLFCLEANPERPLTLQSNSPCAPGTSLECDGMGAAGIGCRLGITAEIAIEPDVLNPKSKGRWITCYIELGEGLDPGDIDVGTVRLNDSIPAEPRPGGIEDHDGDGIGEGMVKFARSAVIDVLEGSGYIEVRVSGEVSGLSFEGADTVRVLDAGLKAAPGGQGEGTARDHVLSVLGGDGPGLTEIHFEISEAGPVTLSIYDVQGRLVRRLVDGPLHPDAYVVGWNGLDEMGARVAGGVYFLRLETESGSATGKAVIVR